MTYFYVDFSDSSKQNTDDLLRSVIRQLASTQDEQYWADNQLSAQSPYENYAPPGQQLETGQLIEALWDLLKDHPHIVIVVDALDECSERPELLDVFVEIAERREPFSKRSVQAWFPAALVSTRVRLK